jgi:hypothetical protein
MIEDSLEWGEQSISCSNTSDEDAGHAGLAGGGESSMRWGDASLNYFGHGRNLTDSKQ